MHLKRQCAPTGLLFRAVYLNSTNHSSYWIGLLIEFGINEKAYRIDFFLGQRGNSMIPYLFYRYGWLWQTSTLYH